MMSHRTLSAALLLCTLAACGQTPTGSDAQAQPAGPAYDGGGYTIGSGNSTTQSGGYTIGSGNSAEGAGGFGMGSGNRDGEADESATSTQSSDAEESGGYTIGSGN